MTSSSYCDILRTDATSFWRQSRPRLGRLDMELTERCNNNCVHCFINRPPDDRCANRELLTEEIKEILGEAASLGCMTVRFTGGEPLLRDDFEDVYLFARKLGLTVLLFTNATLLKPSVVELLAEIPPLEKIEISVYGVNKESYESITRTPGSFEAAFQGMERLLAKRIPFVVKSVITQSNMGEIEEFEAWAGTIPWMDGPPSYSMFLDLRCAVNRPQRNDLIKRLRITPEEALRVLTRNNAEYLDEMKKFCSRFLGPRGPRLFACGAGARSCSVDAYGRLQPCIKLRHPDTVYDLKTGSLHDGITRFLPHVRRMKAVAPEYISRCARCFLKGLCEQCPAKAWGEFGTLDTPVEYVCDIAHALANHLGLLENGEKAWEVTTWRQRIMNLSTLE